MQGSLDRLIVMSALGVSATPQFRPINAGRPAAGTARSTSCRCAVSAPRLLLFIKTQHYILIAATVEIEAIITDCAYG